jgi:hypothetical protein
MIIKMRGAGFIGTFSLQPNNWSRPHSLYVQGAKCEKESQGVRISTRQRSLFTALRAEAAGMELGKGFAEERSIIARDGTLSPFPSRASQLAEDGGELGFAQRMSARAIRGLNALT